MYSYFVSQLRNGAVVLDHLRMHDDLQDIHLVRRSASVHPDSYQTTDGTERKQWRILGMGEHWRNSVRAWLIARTFFLPPVLPPHLSTEEAPNALATDMALSSPRSCRWIALLSILLSTQLSRKGLRDLTEILSSRPFLFLVSSFNY